MNEAINTVKDETINTVNATTFRFKEKDKEKFRKFAEDNEYSNQAEAFEAIMGIIEMAEIKEELKDRSKEIDTFQDTVGKLVGMFVNALNVNKSSEERIRRELSRESLEKDETIKKLNKKIEDLENDKLNLKKESDENNKLISDLNKKIALSEGEIGNLKKENNDKEKTIELLTKSNTNQLQELEKLKDLKENSEILSKRLEEFKKENFDLKNTRTKLEDKIKNSEEMNQFYVNNISDFKKTIEENKIENIELKNKYEKNIEEIKADFENRISKECEAIKESLINKHAVELEKKDLENQKLRIEIEQNKVKTRKTTSKKTQTVR